MFVCLSVCCLHSTITQVEQWVSLSGRAGKDMTKITYSVYTIAKKDLGTKIELCCSRSKAEIILFPQIFLHINGYYDKIKREEG